MLGFKTVKKLYDKATNNHQDQQPAENSKLLQQQPYVRQSIHVPQYDGRTLGIDVSSDIEKFKNFFRGRRLSPDGKMFIPFEGGQEIINEAGAEWLFSNHEILLSISNATTNIENNNLVLEIVEEYADNLLEIVLSQEKDWEIHAAFFDMIIDNLARHYQLFLNKSVKDRQRKWMSGQNPEDGQNVVEPPRFTA